MGCNSLAAASFTPEMQVLICAYGRDGLRRVAAASHPPVEGVEYILSIQKEPADGDLSIPEALRRDDFKIFAHPTKGLAVNRNVALSIASAPILLISDDDVDYTEQGLKSVIKAFHDNPDYDILTFRYESESGEKQYPDSSFPLSTPPKGYFVSSIEIALRRVSVKGKIWFNENFGVGALFPSGEEDIFICDCLDRGLKGIFIPEVIARHDDATTRLRSMSLQSRPQTKGAVFLRLHPLDWPLRMAVHALREIPLWRKGVAPSPLSYCINWLKGVKTAKRIQAFPTPDHSLKYSSHE